MKYKINIKLKIILGIIILGLVTIIFYQSYAIFKESRKLRFIWGVVEDFEQTPDIVINVKVKYWDGTEYQEIEETKFPDKKDFEYKEMTCTNSGNAEFNEDTWQMSIKNITEPTECDIHFVKLLTDEEKYGTSIPAININSCLNLYDKNGQVDLDLGTWTYSRGNCNLVKELLLASKNNKLKNQPDFNSISYIYAGLNTYSFSESELNSWIHIVLNAGTSTSAVSFTDFKLKFSDNSLLTIKEAIDQKYIQPLFLYSSVTHEGLSPAEFYQWPITEESFINNGSSNGVGNWPIMYIFFKQTNKASINGFQLNSSKDWYQNRDGYAVYNMLDFDLSLIPFP